MTPPRRYIHEDIGEEDLWIDLSILTYLREEMLLGDLDYISLRGPYKQGLFASNIDCSWERFRRRALYQVGLGFAEPRIVYGPEGEKIDSKKQTGHLCSLRITPFGFMQIGELEKEIKKYEGFNRYITKAKLFSEKIMGMKGGIVLSITFFLVVCIFVFDIKVSKIIEKIPILSSIIDTKMLQEFEAINQQDEFYRAMMEKPALTTPLDRGDSEEITIDDFLSTPSKPIVNSSLKNPPIPPVIANRLPKDTKIKEMLVNNISTTEKLFKITFDNGMVQYVQVRKEDGKYIIIGK